MTLYTLTQKAAAACSPNGILRCSLAAQTVETGLGVMLLGLRGLSTAKHESRSVDEEQAGPLSSSVSLRPGGLFLGPTCFGRHANHALLFLPETDVIFKGQEIKEKL